MPSKDSQLPLYDIQENIEIIQLILSLSADLGLL